jgi:hypothetical protein
MLVVDDGLIIGFILDRAQYNILTYSSSNIRRNRIHQQAIIVAITCPLQKAYWWLVYLLSNTWCYHVWLCRSLKVSIKKLQAGSKKITFLVMSLRRVCLEPLLAARLASPGKASCLVVARLACLPGKLACLGKKILTSAGEPNWLSRTGKVSSSAREQHPAPPNWTPRPPIRLHRRLIELPYYQISLHHHQIGLRCHWNTIRRCRIDLHPHRIRLHIRRIGAPSPDSASYTIGWTFLVLNRPPVPLVWLPLEL